MPRWPVGSRGEIYNVRCGSNQLKKSVERFVPGMSMRLQYYVW